METRRILWDGHAVAVTRNGDELIGPDGRRVGIDEAEHLAPVEPSKIVCVHLNYESRRAEFGVKLGTAPTYFHKPTTSLNAPACWYSRAIAGILMTVSPCEERRTST